jgi:hypothetical protein
MQFSAENSRPRPDDKSSRVPTQKTFFYFTALIFHNQTSVRIVTLVQYLIYTCGGFSVPNINYIHDMSEINNIAH